MWATAMSEHPRSCTASDKFTGTKIRGYRNQAGLSQAEVGEKLGVSFQQVQKYERGTNRINGERLNQLADLFGCTVPDLLPPLKANGTKRIEASNVDRVAASHDGIKLINYFDGIKDPEHRAAVVDLARRLVPH
jgi:transcriptional regulator with XRE-family HTH domain